MNDIPSHANEMRQNLVTGQWVIYALSRRKRPREIVETRHAPEEQPAYDVSCPFCPGNEEMLPRVILEIKGPDLPWQARIAANKYPVLTPGGDLKRTKRGIYTAMDGYGHHEVIIENPLHNRHFPTMTSQEAEVVIECYHRRYTELMEMEMSIGSSGSDRG
ncbi:MAG TPA: hypothetical protein PLA83_12485 [Deltaproteobacteria bacterium]|nr:hypothetical protein [Deltaproteobacteria bacterium]HQI00229.1 hypothetical protein [Deltaproteobacteria bacterium]HQJ07912.1 hypothetical protein [Deltaproteobacteria bacterium]